VRPAPVLQLPQALQAEGRCSTHRLVWYDEWSARTGCSHPRRGMGMEAGTRDQDGSLARLSFPNAQGQWFPLGAATECLHRTMQQATHTCAVQPSHAHAMCDQRPPHRHRAGKKARQGLAPCWTLENFSTDERKHIKSLIKKILPTPSKSIDTDAKVADAADGQVCPHCGTRLVSLRSGWWPQVES